MSSVPPECSRCRSPLERGDIRCPVCNEGAPVVALQEIESATVEVLRCDSCGAAVSYDVRVRAPACAFCGSVLRLETPDDPPEQVERSLPFAVSRPDAEAAYRSWLEGLGWFRPSDLRSASRLESMTALWWAGWVFDAEADVTWTADSDSGARRAEWAPHAGEAGIVFEDVVVSGSRGLTAAETGRLIPTYDLGTAAAAADEPAPGAVVERFDLPRSSARARVADHIRELVGERLRRGTIPGSRFRNLHTAVVLRRLRTRRVAFPSYVLAYRHRGRLYRVVLSGQDASCLLGSAPYSTVKILAVVFGGVLALALSVALLAAL
jgi:hypothetical protein